MQKTRGERLKGTLLQCYMRAEASLVPASAFQIGVCPSSFFCTSAAVVESWSYCQEGKGE